MCKKKSNEKKIKWTCALNVNILNEQWNWNAFKFAASFQSEMFFFFSSFDILFSILLNVPDKLENLVWIEHMFLR